MFAYHKYVSVAIGVLFVIVLQTFAVPLPVFRFLVPAFLAFAVAVGVYNYYYLQFIDKYNFWLWVKPMMILGSAFGLFMLLPTDFLRSTFLLSAVLVISFFEMFLGNFSENVQINEMLFISFSVFVMFFAYNWYFPPYHFLFIMSVFVSIYLATRSFFEFLPQESAIKQFVAISFALFSTELFWALTFLPFHYSVLAVLLFNVFYFMIMLNHYYFFNILNTKKFQFHLLVMSVFSLVILLATRWSIMS